MTYDEALVKVAGAMGCEAYEGRWYLAGDWFDPTQDANDALAVVAWAMKRDCTFGCDITSVTVLAGRRAIDGWWVMPNVDVPHDSTSASITAVFGKAVVMAAAKLVEAKEAR